MKAYSGVADLPRGQSSDHFTPGCLVMEGGAFRGIYGEGVMDAMMQEDLNFESIIGVSAGALNGLNYAAGQIGRAARINLGNRHDINYVGLKALMLSGGVVNFDYLFSKLSEPEPLNEEYLNNPNHRFFVTATNCESGEMEVFENGKCRDLLKVISASSSMPVVSKIIHIDGKPYLDGGCSVKVPYRWAMDSGYEKIVVIRTRPADYRKKISKISDRIYKMWFHSYPKFAEKLIHMNENYNAACDEMEKLHAEGRIFMISPSEPVTVGRLETDMEKLGALYHLGRKDFYDHFDELKSYLGK